MLPLLLALLRLPLKSRMGPRPGASNAAGLSTPILDRDAAAEFRNSLFCCAAAAAAPRYAAMAADWGGRRAAAAEGGKVAGKAMPIGLVMLRPRPEYTDSSDGERAPPLESRESRDKHLVGGLDANSLEGEVGGVEEEKAEGD